MCAGSDEVERRMQKNSSLEIPCMCMTAKGVCSDQKVLYGYGFVT